MPLLVAAAHFLLARHASLWLHELAHAAAALPAGAKVTAVRVPLLGGNSFTSTAGVGGAEAFVRHAGWICSVYVAVLAARTLTLPCAIAALLVAAEAVVSDLFAIERYRSAPGTFYCGNFGIIVLDRAHAHRVPQLLRVGGHVAQLEQRPYDRQQQQIDSLRPRRLLHAAHAETDVDLSLRREGE